MPATQASKCAAGNVAVTLQVVMPSGGANVVGQHQLRAPAMQPTATGMRPRVNG